MIKEIIHDESFLKKKSQPSNDAQIGQDLLDTLLHNKDNCVGLAANMIGESKRIIAFLDVNKYIVMYNPKILKKSGIYTTEEGCLSLEGKRKTKRYKNIKVKYEDENGNSFVKTYHDFTAQIIQHEIDHCDGILI